MRLEQDWNMDLVLFENNIMQAGFAHHLSVIEKPTYENEPRYYLLIIMIIIFTVSWEIYI